MTNRQRAAEAAQIFDTTPADGDPVRYITRHLDAAEARGRAEGATKERRRIRAVVGGLIPILKPRPCQYADGPGHRDIGCRICDCIAAVDAIDRVTRAPRKGRG